MVVSDAESHEEQNATSKKIVSSLFMRQLLYGVVKLQHITSSAGILISFICTRVH